MNPDGTMPIGSNPRKGRVRRRQKQQKATLEDAPTHSAYRSVKTTFYCQSESRKINRATAHKQKNDKKRAMKKPGRSQQNALLTPFSRHQHRNRFFDAQLTPNFNTLIYNGF
ncbi:MAG: hypothetical protein ACLGJA_13655 [Gammaproteobacteria bacterium]